MKIYDKKKFWSGLGILAIGILFFFYDLSSPSANGFQAKWNLILGLIVMAFGIADSARAPVQKKDAGSANRANGTSGISWCGLPAKRRLWTLCRCYCLWLWWLLW